MSIWEDACGLPRRNTRDCIYSLALELCGVELEDVVGARSLSATKIKKQKQGMIIARNGL